MRVFQVLFSPVTALVLLVGLAGGPARAQEQVAVSGEILDMACYMAKGAKGPGHRTCARMCVKKGAPMGILTDEGDVYLLVDDHDNPDPYEALKKLAGEKARVKGKKFSRGGVAAIVVGAAEKL